ncbi:MAG: phage tail protein [Limnohabitans sp.]
MATFTWIPDYGYQKETRFNVRKTQFGDGYEQRVRFGINTTAETYSLTFENRDNTESDEIEAFLKAREGVESFDWTPPTGTTSIKVVCDEPPTRTPVAYNLNTIRANFRQVFEA